MSATPSEPSLFDLRRLIAPIDPDTFKRVYWEQQPLIVARRDPHYYHELLSLADVDSILSASSIRSSDIRVVRDGQDMLAGKLPGVEVNDAAGGLEALFEQYRQGSTIVLQFLHERWRPLLRLCQSLSAEFSANFQVNVYLTPPNARGLRTHYDLHDVFVLQTEGTKYWRLLEGPVRLPLPQQPYDPNGVEDGKLLEEFDLTPGDLIYIPRGYAHDATSDDMTSLHLTVGVNPVIWSSMILDAIQSVVDRDSRLRESLPPGFAADEGLQKQAEARLTELLDELRRQIQPQAAITDAVNKALLGTQPSLEGHLLDLQAEPLLNLETRLRRRDIPWRLISESQHICLEFHGKIVRMPARVETDLRFITESKEFTAGDLPGRLDEAGRLVLVRCLLREGWLTISQSHRPLARL